MEGPRAPSEEQGDETERGEERREGKDKGERGRMKYGRDREEGRKLRYRWNATWLLFACCPSPRLTYTLPLVPCVSRSQFIPTAPTHTHTSIDTCTCTKSGHKSASECCWDRDTQDRPMLCLERMQMYLPPAHHPLSLFLSLVLLLLLSAPSFLSPRSLSGVFCLMFLTPFNLGSAHVSSTLHSLFPLVSL